MQTLSQIEPLWIDALGSRDIINLHRFRERPETQITGYSAPYAEATIEGASCTTRTNAQKSTLEPIDVLQVRNALKLSAKLFADSRFAWGPGNDLPFCAHLAEVGTLLSATGADSDLIQAGLLYPALSDVRLDLHRSSDALARKFSPYVRLLIELAGESLELSPHEFSRMLHDNPRIGPDLAMLHCAITTARCGAGLTIHHPRRHEGFQRVYEEFGVAPALVNQYLVERGGSARFTPQGDIPSAYTLHETIDIRNALRAATVVFRNSLRKWGPEERIPLIAHAAEVGLLLIMSGQNRDVVVAGLLHDFLEGYGGKPGDLSTIVARFGTSVLTLVDNITEPTRCMVTNGSETLEEWRERKMTVLNRMRNGSPEFAELCAATKISTLAAGNKMLYLKGKFTDWSNGPIDANLEMYIEFREAYEALGQSPVLKCQLDLEIERLILQSSNIPSGEPGGRVYGIHQPVSA